MSKHIKGVKIENKENKLCDYGCGLKAQYQFKNKKLCCSENTSSCLGVKNKHIDSMLNYIKIENPNHILCDYGCGLEAQYQINNKKLCCGKSYKSCPVSRKKHSESMKNVDVSPKPKKIENKENKLCDYGCELKANYQFKNKKLCCEDDSRSCPKICDIRSKSNKGKNHSEETKKKISKINKGRKCLEETKRKLSELNTGKTHTKETKLKISKIQTYSLHDWKNKHPLLFKEEELRYHPKTREIQAHCKNNKCKNSKEQGGWFTPLRNNISNRVSSLENGSGGGYLYCCDQCKQECILYHMKNDPNEIKDINNIPTESDKQVFRQEVLKRDNYKCFYHSDVKAIDVHHIRPQKLEPFFALDPDYGISVCEECHKELHKSGSDCSYGKLSKIICK